MRRPLPRQRCVSCHRFRFPLALVESLEKEAAFFIWLSVVCPVSLPPIAVKLKPLHFSFREFFTFPVNRKKKSTRIFIIIIFFFLCALCDWAETRGRACVPGACFRRAAVAPACLA